MAVYRPLTVVILATLSACGLPSAGAEPGGPSAANASTTIGSTVAPTTVVTTTDPSTTAPPDTTVVLDSTVPPDTTTPDTTLPPDSTVSPDTTHPPDSTTTTETSEPPTTQEPPSTTGPPEPTTTEVPASTDPPTATTSDHPPLHGSADAGSTADRETPRGPRSDPPTPTTVVDASASARAAADGISYELALERNRFDLVRPRHPRSEVDRWYWAVVDSGLDDVDKWLYRICRESKGDPGAWNRGDPSGGSVGLLQINLGNRAFLGNVGVLSSPQLSRQAAAIELMDPRTNLRAALALVESGGERGWITRYRTPECVPPSGLPW